MKMSLLGMNEAAHLKMKISPNLSKAVKKTSGNFIFSLPTSNSQVLLQVPAPEISSSLIFLDKGSAYS